ncbi:MAG: DUF58 domain-containing protein [Actinomycetota bacterium]|nr:MAG: DUF58 domain-containing protein [Actinomycetota bacterium]
MTRLPGRPTATDWVSESVGTQVNRAAVLRRLELDVIRRLDGRLTGDHRTAAYGPGSERAAARPYQPGDDARRIDWSLTARSLTAHVRTTEADRELETWVLADRSASMDFGTAQREKRDVVLGVAAAFGVLTARAGNRFGVMAFGGDALVHRPAATGRRGMLAGLATLYDCARQGGTPGPGADLAAALRTLPRVQPRRGLVVVVSDFHDDADWAHALRELTLRQSVIAAVVTDPRDNVLPDVGMLDVVDPETGRLLHVQTRSPKLRSRFAEAAQARQDRIHTSIRSTGAALVSLSTDRDWLTDVIGFATGRAVIRRTAALQGVSS